MQIGQGDFNTRTLPSQFRPAVDHPGGCYACRFFGERRDPAVWCARPGGEHVRSVPERGCAFWEREPGADLEDAAGINRPTEKALRTSMGMAIARIDAEGPFQARLVSLLVTT